MISTPPGLAAPAVQRLEEVTESWAGAIEFVEETAKTGEMIAGLKAAQRAVKLAPTSVRSQQSLAALRVPVDAFFDAVMVNAEDAQLRANRLGLLATLHQAMNRVADLSRLSA